MCTGRVRGCALVQWQMQRAHAAATHQHSSLQLHSGRPRGRRRLAWLLLLLAEGSARAHARAGHDTGQLRGVGNVRICCNTRNSGSTTFRATAWLLEHSRAPASAVATADGTATMTASALGLRGGIWGCLLGVNFRELGCPSDQDEAQHQNHEPGAGWWGRHGGGLFCEPA